MHIVISLNANSIHINMKLASAPPSLWIHLAINILGTPLEKSSSMYGLDLYAKEFLFLKIWETPTLAIRMKTFNIPSLWSLMQIKRLSKKLMEIILYDQLIYFVWLYHISIIYISWIIIKMSMSIKWFYLNKI